jgi:hypothetical protein
VDAETKGCDRLIGTAPMIMIHVENNMRGKHPTEKGFMATPLDWGRAGGEV